MPDMHQYRRHSTQFPGDFGLTQPISTYGREREEGDPSRLELEPYMRHTYSHRRKHKSHARSRHRIPEEPRRDTSVSDAYGAESISNDLNGDELDKPKLPGQIFRGHSSSVTNLSSRPPRYSSRTLRGSQEYLRLSEERTGPTSSAFSRSTDAISPAVVSAHHALTQPVYPEEEESVTGVGWSQRASSMQPLTGKPPLIVVDEEEGEERKSHRAKGSLFRSASLNPQLKPTVNSNRLNLESKYDVDSNTSAEDDMATGSTHIDGVSPDNKSKQVDKAINDQEETPVTWEVMMSVP